jgi:hypothetical protein
MNGLMKPATLLMTGDSNMVIRGITYYAFTNYVAPSVFSSETQLTWRWSLSRPNSQGWWKAQSGKIRISISLDTQLFSLEPDLPIGASLALLRNTNLNQYCDYCKQRYAHLSRGGELHQLARKPAYWKVVSEHPKRKGITRFYCLECAADIQNWPDGTFYSLKEQLQDALKDTAQREYLNVELPR